MLSSINEFRENWPSASFTFLSCVRNLLPYFLYLLSDLGEIWHKMLLRIYDFRKQKNIGARKAVYFMGVNGIVFTCVS